MDVFFGLMVPTFFMFGWWTCLAMYGRAVRDIHQTGRSFDDLNDGCAIPG